MGDASHASAGDMGHSSFGDAGDASSGDMGDAGDFDSGGGADADGSADGADDGNGDHSHGGGNPILSFFGFGRVPTMLLVEGFGLFWGATGFYATRMLSAEEGASPETFALRAAEIAALSGVFGTKIIGELGSRFMPSHETYALTQEDLIGSTGIAIFPVSETMGRVRIYDRHGGMHDESARLIPGETEAIGRNESVLLVQYDETGGFFLVEKSPV
jgi:hypothetical protein